MAMSSTQKKQPMSVTVPMGGMPGWQLRMVGRAKISAMAATCIAAGISRGLEEGGVSVVWG